MEQLKEEFKERHLDERGLSLEIFEISAFIPGRCHAVNLYFRPLDITIVYWCDGHTENIDGFKTPPDRRLEVIKDHIYIEQNLAQIEQKLTKWRRKITKRKFAPGGPGYIAAQAEFNALANQ